MNKEQLKKELSDAVKMAEYVHDDLVDILADSSVATETWCRLVQSVSGLATLKWYLEHISEGVGA